jgi:DNA-directed RNA polymerase subunit RPC12/RpoP
MNTNKTIECLRCHAQMEVGYVADGTHAGFAQQNWSPGTPTKSFWMGLKMKADQLVPVTTLRCPNCGYLESYAVPPV